MNSYNLNASSVLHTTNWYSTECLVLVLPVFDLMLNLCKAFATFKLRFQICTFKECSSLPSLFIISLILKNTSLFSSFFFYLLFLSMHCVCNLGVYMCQCNCIHNLLVRWVILIKYKNLLQSFFFELLVYNK